MSGNLQTHSTTSTEFPRFPTTVVSGNLHNAGKTICLNMIVKNESHIILKTLNNIIGKIKIDYWVIGDNGSTDNTKQIITDFFIEHKIPGELYEDEWVNFGHNRTKALERAYNKTDYVFIFDADDEIYGDLRIPTCNLTHDGYNMIFLGSLTYQRKCLVNNRKKWKYVGVLHEYIEFSDIGPCNVDSIEGNYYIKSNRLGARNLDPNKYLKDAKLLENGYNQAIQENDKIYNRYAFYCANSYRDAGNYTSAIEWYKKTLDHDGWIQERYVSCLHLYDLYTKQKDVPTGLYYLIKAYQCDKTRVEAIYELAKYYCIEKMNDVAYMYYTLIEDYYENKSLSDTMTDKLFVRINDYFFYFPYYMIIICERLKKYTNGIRMYEIIFEKKIAGISQWWVDNLIYNLQFFIDKVDHTTNPLFFRNCEAYLNWLIENKYTIDNEMINFFIGSGRFPVTLVQGNQINSINVIEASAANISESRERNVAAKQELRSSDDLGPKTLESEKATDSINTALIVEPRDLNKLPIIINEYFNVLGPNWKIVFYCGTGLKQKWESQLDKSVEIREMSIKNLLPNEYNDLFKTKQLWESLYGEFVLVFQPDTWILNQAPYTIDYFMGLNKSYIGGNMKLTFHELNRERIYPKYMNFNGGLSLRKRTDMIKIIDAFGSEKTIEPSRNSTKIQTDAEDVYFTLGCYNLGLPIGDDENCGHFALMAFFHEKCFGIHRPLYARAKIIETYPDLIHKCYI